MIFSESYFARPSGWIGDNLLVLQRLRDKTITALSEEEWPWGIYNHRISIGSKITFQQPKSKVVVERSEQKPPGVSYLLILPFQADDYHFMVIQACRIYWYYYGLDDYLIGILKNNLFLLIKTNAICQCILYVGIQWQIGFVGGIGGFFIAIHWFVISQSGLKKKMLFFLNQWMYQTPIKLHWQHHFECGSYG